jgi:hypothetical protein
MSLSVSSIPITRRSKDSTRAGRAARELTENILNVEVCYELRSRYEARCGSLAESSIKQSSSAFLLSDNIFEEERSCENGLGQAAAIGTQMT